MRPIVMGDARRAWPPAPGRRAPARRGSMMGSRAGSERRSGRRPPPFEGVVGRRTDARRDPARDRRAALRRGRARHDLAARSAPPGWRAAGRHGALRTRVREPLGATGVLFVLALPAFLPPSTGSAKVSLYRPTSAVTGPSRCSGDRRPRQQGPLRGGHDRRTRHGHRHREMVQHHQGATASSRPTGGRQGRLRPHLRRRALRADRPSQTTQKVTFDLETGRDGRQSARQPAARLSP